jgi:IS605 OrfB family transposase
MLGTPVTVPLDLDGLPAATRDGRLRTAISQVIATARQRGARAVVIEDLNFTAARAEGRERTGSRPQRGKRGKAFRRTVTGIPTGRFRDRLAQMASNAGLAVIAVDPAYTSRWGAEHWLAPLRGDHPGLTGHHAAAVVIGRRALGHRARRRASVPAAGQRTSSRRTAPEHPAASAQPGTAEPARLGGSHHGGVTPRPPNGTTRPTRRPTTVRGHRIAGTIPANSLGTVFGILLSRTPVAAGATLTARSPAPA